MNKTRHSNRLAGAVAGLIGSLLSMGAGTAYAGTYDQEIAYIDSGLKIMRADGTNIKTVVALKTGEVAYKPCWSPDGQSLLFWGRIGGTWGLWTVNINGTNRRLVYSSPVSTVYYFDWARRPAPDGKIKICFSTRVEISPGQMSSVDVFIANADGTGVANLTNTPNINEASVCWTNDGSRLAYLRGTTLVVMNLGLDGQGAVTAVSEEDVYALGGSAIAPLHWANSFEGLTTSSSQNRTTILDLGVFPPTLRELTAPVVGQDRYSSFSLNDSKVVISRLANGIWSLYTINFDGTGERKIGRGAEANWKRPLPSGP